MLQIYKPIIVSGIACPDTSAWGTFSTHSAVLGYFPAKIWQVFWKTLKQKMIFWIILTYWFRVDGFPIWFMFYLCLMQFSVMIDLVLMRPNVGMWIMICVCVFSWRFFFHQTLKGDDQHVGKRGFASSYWLSQVTLDHKKNQYSLNMGFRIIEIWLSGAQSPYRDGIFSE